MNQLRKFWKFLWYDESLLSWILNVIIAFLLVRFIIYPALGLILATTHPVVAVVSGSMEHDSKNFDQWWLENKEFYEGENIKREEFEKYPFKNGFNKGDIMVLTNRGQDIKVGDIAVFYSNTPNPIIHRVINMNEGYETKGDHNPIKDKDVKKRKDIIGRAVFRIPLLGWIKIIFVEALNFMR